MSAVFAKAWVAAGAPPRIIAPMLLSRSRRARRNPAPSPTAACGCSGARGALVAFGVGLFGAAALAQSSAPPHRADTSTHRETGKEKKAAPKAKSVAPTTKPAPPLRPPHVAPQPVTPAPVHPAHQEGGAKPAPPELPPLDTSTPPPKLPPAAREKMHACALEWMKVKQQARAPWPMWKDFATGCLTRQ